MFSAKYLFLQMGNCQHWSKNSALAKMTIHLHICYTWMSYIFIGYVGCYEDKSPDRDLPTILSVPNLTPDSCRSGCQGAGHAYAGVQYGYLCRCGDSYGKYTKVSDEECNALCVGDRAQKCGGFWRSAVFTTGKWGLQD